MVYRNDCALCVCIPVPVRVPAFLRADNLPLDVEGWPTAGVRSEVAM